MENIVNSVTRFVTNGISYILGVLADIINWTVHQLQAFANLPWATMSIWKLLIAIAAFGLCGYLLYRKGKELLDATVDIFEAFALWFMVLIKTLPTLIAVGVVLAMAIWVIKTFRF